MNKKIIILSVFFMFFIFFISILFSVLNMGNNNIFSKISVNNVDISKKSKDAANSLIKDMISKKVKSKINLEYSFNDELYRKSIDLSMLNISCNTEEVISKAYNLGRTGNIFENNFVISKLLFKQAKFNLDINYDEDIIKTIISDISSNLPGKMIQTSYYIEDENLIVTKGTPGVVVDEEILLKKINESISDISSDEITLSIPVKTVQPDNINFEKIHQEIYKEAKNAYYEKDPFKVYPEVVGIDFDLENAKKHFLENPNDTEYTLTLKYSYPQTTISNLNIDVFPDLLGTFSTNYDASNKSRSNNLNLAAKKIDGLILSPGEEFSYNKVVGERTIAAGYKEAKIYSNGKIIDGLGGGICQVSSTLYNAVIFANLKVTQRYNHQFITSYVPAGRDATVAYGAKDFKFINNRTYPIKINVNISSGVAKIDIYGIKEDNENDIKFDTEVVSNIPYETKYEIDKSLSAGTEVVKQRGVDGIIVDVYKIISKNGITISREFISKDKYNSLEKIISKSLID